MRHHRFGTWLEHQVDTRSVRFAVWLYRVTGGQAPHLWHRRALVLTTIGRRSGQPRTVLVQCFADGDAWLVVAANSGLDSNPGWYHNLKAHPHAHIEVEGRRFEVRAVELTPAEAAAFWPRVLEAAPDYAKYTERTSRSLPLLRLVPPDVSTVTSSDGGTARRVTPARRAP